MKIEKCSTCQKEYRYPSDIIRELLVCQNPRCGKTVTRTFWQADLFGGPKKFIDVWEEMQVKVYGLKSLKKARHYPYSVYSLMEDD